MPDLEKVIYSIERCICHVPDACRDCYYDELPAPECIDHLMRDAHALLKAQEPVKAIQILPGMRKDGEVGMIVTNDGYSIWHEKRANRIIISLPQTMETVRNTMTMIVNRKSEFTDSELVAILSVAKAIAEGLGSGDEPPKEE